MYKTTAEYAPECDRGIKYDDPLIGIEWPEVGELILSDKDQKQPLLNDADINFIYKNRSNYDKRTLLVTGGVGFIGSAVVRQLINHSDYHVVNIDKLTYAGNLESLKEISDNPRYVFEQVDIGDKENISRIFEQYQPVGILHLAAESHVDRSISGPGEFIMTNIVGSYNLLECAREYYSSLTDKAQFKFVHISTDEVFGSLGDTGYFREDTAYDPRSPYSASKASSDLLARAWYHTYNLPIVITNCTNNYGPYHFSREINSTSDK